MTEPNWKRDAEHWQSIAESALTALVDGADQDLKTQLLQAQVKGLADRLAIAMSIFRQLEMDAGLSLDHEGVEYWERVQRMLIGKDNPALDHERKEQRKMGEYAHALTRVRGWLSRSLAVVRGKAQPEKRAA